MTTNRQAVGQAPDSALDAAVERVMAYVQTLGNPTNITANFSSRPPTHAEIAARCRQELEARYEAGRRDATARLIPAAIAVRERLAREGFHPDTQWPCYCVHNNGMDCAYCVLALEMDELATFMETKQ